MRTPGRRIQFLAAVLYVLAIVPVAYAAQGNFYCNGWTTWSGGGHAMFKIDCSVPAGSVRETALNQSVLSWKQVNPDLNRFSFTAFKGACSSMFSNSMNEFNIVTRSQISGKNGLTQSLPSTCFTGAAHWLEGDVLVASDMDFGIEDPSFFGINPMPELKQGQVVILHELGHWFALGHDDNQFAVMRTYTPYPLVGGSLWHGWPQADDAFGIRFFYPAGPGITNVYVSAQTRNASNQIVATNSDGTISRCRGGTFSLSYTAGNNGATNVVNTGFRIYLTQTPGVAAGGTNIFTSSGAGVTGFGTWTETRIFTVPTSLPNGTYWIQWQINTANTPEQISGDNFVHSAMTINVNC